MTSQGSTKRFRRSVFCLLSLTFLLFASCSPSQHNNTAWLGNWHEFEGIWTAAGTRNVLRFDRGDKATIAKFTGSLTLAGTNKPAVGFRSEAILFSDSKTGLIGRAIWTDERGNEAYSELRGDPSTSNKIIGTFAGGTGRYAGATGSYEFTWRFLIENEEGEVQGQSVGLKGRVRVERAREN